MPKMAGVMVLMKFFGRKPDQTLKDFNDELKNLSPVEKTELIVLAAREMGVEVAETIVGVAA